MLTAEATREGDMECDSEKRLEMGFKDPCNLVKYKHVLFIFFEDDIIRGQVPKASDPK